MKYYLLLVVLIFLSMVASAQSDTSQHIVAGRSNSSAQQKKPYVIMISADGFRYDYAEKYHAVNLLQLSNNGVRSKAMIPSYPSLTYPNHYTLATGMYPSHNGLVGNNFFDRNRQQQYTMSNRELVTDKYYYGGTPLWVLAEQQQMLTANFYWVGSEAPIQDTYSTYYYLYNDTTSITQRINTVKNWLQLPEETRPHLINFYFPEVDHVGHLYGPDSEETGAAVLTLDSSIKALTAAVASTGLPVNYIFVSDHGMTRLDTAHKVIAPAVDSSEFVVSAGAQIIQLYAKDRKNISSTFKMLSKKQAGFKTYLKETLPVNLHYGIADDTFNRIGDIILIPDWPRSFGTLAKKQNPGAHGFNPYKVRDMHATFLCWGPAFKSHLVIPPFENVQVFAVVANILGLPMPAGIDGNERISKEILLP